MIYYIKYKVILSYYLKKKLTYKRTFEIYPHVSICIYMHVGIYVRDLVQCQKRPRIVYTCMWGIYACEYVYIIYHVRIYIYTCSRALNMYIHVLHKITVKRPFEHVLQKRPSTVSKKT